MVIIVNLIKHWFMIWGLYWALFGGIAIMSGMVVGADAMEYAIPMGILIIGIGSLYYGKDWFN